MENEPNSAKLHLLLLNFFNSIQGRLRISFLKNFHLQNKIQGLILYYQIKAIEHFTMIKIRHGKFYPLDLPLIHFILLIYRMEIFLLNSKEQFQVWTSDSKTNMVFLRHFRSHLINDRSFKIKFFSYLGSTVVES